MFRSPFFAMRTIAPMLLAAGFANPSAAADAAPVRAAATTAPMGGPTLTLVRQSAPALIAPGARRLAELRSEHRSLADLAKRAGQVFTGAYDHTFKLVLEGPRGTQPL